MRNTKTILLLVMVKKKITKPIKATTELHMNTHTHKKPVNFEQHQGQAKRYA